MRKAIAILMLFLPINGTCSDKIRHFGAGFSIAITTNVILFSAQDAISQADGEPLGPIHRALFSSLVAGLAGAFYEYLNRGESIPDQKDVLATFAGGVGAGLFTIAIDF